MRGRNQHRAETRHARDVGRGVQAWHRCRGDLLPASAYLIRDQVYLLDRLERIFERSSRHFTRAQAGWMIGMMTRIGTLESALNEKQLKLITATERSFETLFRRNRQWAPGG